jgi:outer membrane immunogenic protein
MNKCFAVLIALLTLATDTFAADIGTGSFKDGPVYVPSTSWTGFYAGASVGASFNHSNMTGEGAYPGYPGSFVSLEGNFPVSPNSQHTSAIASAEAGYNWQIGRYVLGIAVDLNWLNSSHTSRVGYIDGGELILDSVDIMRNKVEYLSTFRGRLGYAAANDILLYGTGGLAIARFKGGYDDLPQHGDGASNPYDTEWGVGWAAGAGVDYRLSTHWLGRAEYLHVETSAKLTSYCPSETEQFVQISKLQQDMVRFGLLYQF